MQNAKKLPPNLKGGEFQDGLKKLVGIATFSDHSHFLEWFRLRERKAAKERNTPEAIEAPPVSKPNEIVQIQGDKQIWLDNPVLRPIHIHRETRHLGWIAVTTAVFIGIAIGRKADHYSDQKLAIQIANDFLISKKKPKEPESPQKNDATGPSTK